MISIFAISILPRLLLASVAEQTGLCLTWSQRFSCDVAHVFMILLNLSHNSDWVQQLVRMRVHLVCIRSRVRYSQQHSLVMNKFSLPLVQEGQLSVTVMILSFHTDIPGQTGQTQISSLIRVYTVCHSICIIWTHYSMVEPHSSDFRVISINVWGVWILRKFTVLAKECALLVLVNCPGGLPRRHVDRITDHAWNDLKSVKGP